MPPFSLFARSVLGIVACSLVSIAQPTAAGPRSNSRTGTAPVVQVHNGSYYGIHNAAYKEDLFLGIPFAQPPVGALRYQNPQPLNTTWSGTKNATQYSAECWGFGSDDWVLGNPVSEDCLTLNVVRPAGVAADQKLPVAVWIYGGGFFNGGSLDPRYNLSFIVERSVAMNKPMIGVSLNYRLQGLGALFSNEMLDAGVANLGLKDQRLALAWLHENIGAFGGDPSKVTIWGESAGASSVGWQLVAYGGRDDGLFRAAIEESGGPVDTKPVLTADDWQPFYDNITAAVGCGATVTSDSLACLRGVPIATLAAVLNSSVTAGVPSWGGSVDGDFLPNKTTALLLSGQFARVPLLHGRNHDEGTMFATQGINTSQEFVADVVDAGFSNETAATIAILYPDIPGVGIPATLDGRPTGADAYLGHQWKRSAAFSGDLVQHAPRRLISQTYARFNVSSWSYVFNVLVHGLSPVADGATHFQEVAFVFDNTQGLGYDTVVAQDPFEGEPETFDELAKIMSSMWVSFVVEGDPNCSGATDVHWPVYTLDEPYNILFDVNITGLVRAEPDDYRAAQIQYLQEEMISTFG
ncbi:triacylglycerol lipase [Coniella lustricola]|uniref:Carboxylic ester hydrolase n=1 Tax=Coniella lustricola TaxID=2025994 RepID=A0A2T3AJB3_9PEZI|nr:triacylglycerol lipase [Coniella lustricola]